MAGSWPCGPGWSGGFSRPIIPLIVIALLAGADVIRRRYDARLGTALAVGLAAVVVFTGVRADWDEIRAFRGCDRKAPLESSGCFDADQRSLFAASRFVAANTPDSAVVITAKDAVFALYSGRRVVRPRAVLAADPAVFVAPAGRKWCGLRLSRQHSCHRTRRRSPGTSGAPAPPWISLIRFLPVPSCSGQPRLLPPIRRRRHAVPCPSTGPRCEPVGRRTTRPRAQPTLPFQYSSCSQGAQFATSQAWGFRGFGGRGDSNGPQPSSQVLFQPYFAFCSGWRQRPEVIGLTQVPASRTDVWRGSHNRGRPGTHDRTCRGGTRR